MQELWDLYDIKRNPLGLTHVRGTRMRRGTYHIAVGIWTVNDRNEILITLRSPEKHDWPDLWENTAGSLLAGETSRQGAVRELFEDKGGGGRAFLPRNRDRTLHDRRLLYCQKERRYKGHRLSEGRDLLRKMGHPPRP